MVEATSKHEVTRLLVSLGDGDDSVLDKLMPLVYVELRRLARSRLGSERSDHTLNTTALVHEAYMKLADQNRINWQSRAQFFALASQAMRRILVDYARRRNAAKRKYVHQYIGDIEYRCAACIDESSALDLETERRCKQKAELEFTT